MPGIDTCLCQCFRPEYASHRVSPRKERSVCLVGRPIAPLRSASCRLTPQRFAHVKEASLRLALNRVASQRLVRLPLAPLRLVWFRLTWLPRGPLKSIWLRSAPCPSPSGHISGSQPSRHSRPCLRHSTNSGVAEGFYAHGEISEKMPHVTKIRLMSPDGLMLEDTAHNGLVIFANRERPAFPFWLEMYNDAGQLIGQQTERGLR